ncbi:hypothetical protein C8A00DRAFT_36733 [Chaetomidium leptoderma]|uniref:Uncharacterized protein n=1 Tax=Chaetomidium leptoderma TaxID=669021 RepID=A0AAN6VG63_9PEZI|nr:hypothetical protein C8A00DRAFT_36733 [Chaetomidium leptoderma]
MPTLLSTASYNAYDPGCTVNACLQQVAGILDGNPLVQYASCTSLYGSPTVSTVTPAADVVFSTTTSTLSYTDTVISLLTEYSTEEEASTSYSTIFDVETSYTTTLYVTVTESTAAPTFALQRRDAKKKKRGNCGTKPSTTSAPPSPTPSSSDSFSTTSSAVPSSAPACADEAEHSSACACIDAVSTVAVVTAPATTSTSTIHETVSTTIIEIEPSVVTVAVTTVIVYPAITTATSVLQTEAVGTTTVTTTTTPIAPTQTAYVVFADGPRAGKPLNVVSGYVQWANTGAGSKIAFAVDGGSPWLPSHSAYNDVRVSCSVNPVNGYLSCASTTGVHTKVLQCGAYVYLAAPGFSQGSCVEVNLKLTPWLA